VQFQGGNWCFVNFREVIDETYNFRRVSPIYSFFIQKKSTTIFQKPSPIQHLHQQQTNSIFFCPENTTLSPSSSSSLYLDSNPESDSESESETPNPNQIQTHKQRKKNPNLNPFLFLCACVPELAKNLNPLKPMKSIAKIRRERACVGKMIMNLHLCGKMMTMCCCGLLCCWRCDKKKREVVEKKRKKKDTMKRRRGSWFNFIFKWNK